MCVKFHSQYLGSDLLIFLVWSTLFHLKSFLNLNLKPIFTLDNFFFLYCPKDTYLDDVSSKLQLFGQTINRHCNGFNCSLLWFNIIENNEIIIKANLQWISLEFDHCVLLLSFYIVWKKQYEPRVSSLLIQCVLETGRNNCIACPLKLHFYNSILYKLHFSNFW